MSTEMAGATESTSTTGAPSAAELLPLVYDELRLIAARKLSGEKPGQTLQATALVHEAWLKMGANRQQPFAGQKHFFSVAARAMQQILIDNARRKLTERHGSGKKPEPLEESRIAIVASSDELIAVNDSLEQLELEDSQSAEIVRLRYFVGMTVPEIATALELSPRTVDRHWAFARAWLKRAIHGAAS